MALFVKTAIFGGLLMLRSILILTAFFGSGRIMLVLQRRKWRLPTVEQLVKVTLVVTVGSRF